MKSKISFFNKTIFWKNITLYWPIWAIYLLVLLILVPGQLWTSFQAQMRYSQTGILASSDVLNIMCQSLNIGTTILFAFLMSMITGMALYNYLYVARTTNMIHAFPVTRGQLYGTNVISGLLFMLVPEVIAFVGGVLVCLSLQVTNVEYLGIWLLVTMGISVLFYSIVTFCAMLTGQMMALPIYAFVIQFISLGVYQILTHAVTFLGYGLSRGSIENFKLMWLSPLYYLLEHVYFRSHRTLVGDSYQTDIMQLQGGDIVAWYLLLALVLFVAAYLLYRKRSLEHAGDLVAVAAVKPIFRWGVGCVGGVLLAIWAESFFEEIFGTAPKAAVFIVFFVAGILCFFAAEMLVKKNFRVFQKQAIRESVLFVFFLAAALGATAGYAYAKEQYVPEVSEISGVTVYGSYRLNLTDEEDVAYVTRLHEYVTAHAKAYRDVDFQLNDYWWLQFTYTLNDGSIVRRSYSIPINAESQAEFADFYELEATHYADYLFGGVDDLSIYEDGYLQVYGEDWNYATQVEFGEAEAAVLVKAIQADLKERNLQKYNLYDMTGTHTATPYMADLAIWGSDYDRQAEFWDEQSTYLPGYTYYTSYDEVSRSYDLWFDFGPDCSNIIDALLDLGMIESQDELLLQEE
jgi:ABC-2 type transport system permease protein